ncbi:SDR family oxidoreductase [Tetragenococcus muriaticus]|uniref:SDR family oxidoreductase n=1 Tax=Tetragenococcus muriaticus TaxID=64642 RepID=UPI000412E6E4|nr:SDR family oxidoreductase [Tetragenococcus muriaticus]GMA47584.1 NAD-dependent dehydratase [Tetragenococcus muriaticus]
MTKNVLILGANGQIARQVEDMLLDEQADIHLTLFLRRSSRLQQLSSDERVTVIDGDVLNMASLKEAMHGQDIVYANLDGSDLKEQANNIMQAMNSVGVDRLIFVSAGGIYDELPGKFGEWNKRVMGSILVPYRESVEAIEEANSVDYTILRPVWLTNYDEIDYETTRKGETFKGTEVSRKSVAALVVQLILHPEQEIGESLGVNKPNTDGDKPAFFK